MTTLAAPTGVRCAACSSRSGTEWSDYFRMDLCRRCWIEARDRLGLAAHPTLDIAGVAIQEGFAL